MGNLSSSTLKCHISLMIYCHIHVYHVLSVVSDLPSQIYVEGGGVLLGILGGSVPLGPPYFRVKNVIFHTCSDKGLKF